MVRSLDMKCSFDHPRRVRGALFSLVALALLTTAACSHQAVHQPLAMNHFVGNGQDPVLVADYQPWFGQRSHIDVGYSSVDRVKIEQQIDHARQLGIAAFIVNWYGQHHSFEDKAYSLMQQVAAEKDFKVALMYDEDDRNPESSTDTVIADLQYAYDRYIGPQAAISRNSYLRYESRPMIFIFPKGGHTDWNQVRQATNAWGDPPLLIIKDINAKFASDFDGFYAWVNPGKAGWSPNGANWGEDYLENFYQTMIAQYPDKIAVGAAWPGFNDSRASWSLNRHMSARCGKTFDDTLRLFRRYYNGQRPLPFLMIETWNDYEEGTAIEGGTVECK
jgi:hypothetical protein